MTTTDATTTDPTTTSGAAGRAAVEQIAPGHVAEVRRLVFDQLTPDQVDQLSRIATELLDAASS